ncbi:MAG: ABC transporter substrate-binding protein [Streptosporangiales bacterium]|nr:ABC transporter substrate-binding protein [Streptosporangiales bacterium]
MTGRTTSRRRRGKKGNTPGRARVSPILVFGALFGVVAFACSPPGGDVAQPGGGGEDDVIKAGLIAPLTGVAAAPGNDMVDGWNLYFKLNGTQFAGKKIETVTEDTAGDPATALNKTEQLLGRTGSDFIVGPALASSGLAIAGQISRQGVPFFLPVVSADDLTQRGRLPGVVRIAGWSSSQTTHAFGQWAYDQGYRRVVTLCTDYAFGHESCGGFVNTFTDAGGKVVKQLWQPLGTQDFGTYVAQIREADPDAVFVLTVGAESPRFVKAWSDFGLKNKIPLLGGETTLDQSLLRGMGGEATGLTSIGHFVEGRDSPATQRFVEAYQKEYGKLPSYYAAAMYTAAQWITQAIKEVGGDVSNTDAFLKAIRGVQLEDSALGPIRLDEYDNPVQNVYLRKVEKRDDGKLWNVPEQTFPQVSQFWKYEPQEFLDHPVYGREYQGNGVWPEPRK